MRSADPLENSNQLFYEWIAPYYARAYGWLDSRRTVQRWGALAAPLLSDSHVPKKEKPILADVGCGPGLHCVHWAKLGFDVVGVDSSDSMIRTAKIRARKAGVGVRFCMGDLREEILPLAASLVVCHTYFVHLFPADELRRVAKGLFVMAQKDAVLMFEHSNLRERCRQGRMKVEGADLEGMEIETSLERRTGVIIQTWRYQDQVAREYFWSHAARSVRQIFESAGWNFVAILSEDAVATKRAAGQRGVMVFRKA